MKDQECGEEQDRTNTQRQLGGTGQDWRGKTCNLHSIGTPSHVAGMRMSIYRLGELEARGVQPEGREQWLQRSAAASPYDQPS